MKIAYYLESTELYGGIKVVFRQAEALRARGHEVKIVTRGGDPAWFSGKVPVTDNFHELKRAHWVISTYYTHIKRLYDILDNGTGLVHLSQGYEGGWPEARPNLKEIEEAYSLPIPRMVVSSNIKQDLKRRFNIHGFNIGQGIEHEFFFPADMEIRTPPKRIFLMGIYPAWVKNLETALSALKTVRHEYGMDFELIRITTVDSKRIEMGLFEDINRYYTNILPQQVGKILRQGGIMICPNREAEGFNLPAVEAMACGIPVVLSMVPAHLSYSVKRDYALFFHPEDSRGLAQRVVELINDSSLYNKLSKRGVKVAKKFQFDKVARRIELYLCFLSLKKRGRERSPF